MWDITKRAVPARTKRDIANRQSTSTLRTKHVRANQPFTALLQQAYHGVGSTASHRHQNHVRSGQKRSPVQGPRRSIGVRGEISLNGVTSNCPRGTSSQAPRGRQPAREWAEQEPPPSITSRCWPCAHTPSAKELEQVKPGGARDE